MTGVLDRNTVALVVRTVLLLITAGALAACGSSNASPSVATSSSSAVSARADCGPAGARTLARGSEARVYVQRHTVYACLTAGRRRLTLGTLGTCVRASHVDAVAVAGRSVAAAVTSCGVDMGSAEVIVVHGSGWHRVFTGPALANPGPESFTQVPGLVVSPAGAVAWIASSASIAAHHRTTEVLAASAGATRVLDSGTEIITGSLRRSGATVSWRHGASRRSARLS